MTMSFKKSQDISSSYVFAIAIFSNIIFFKLINVSGAFNVMADSVVGLLEKKTKSKKFDFQKEHKLNAKGTPLES